MGKINPVPEDWNKYYLSRESFFAYDQQATLEDWNEYVQSDPELAETEERIFKKAA